MDVISTKLGRVARTALRTYFEPITWVWRWGVRRIKAMERGLGRETDVDDLSASQWAALRADAEKHLPKGRLRSEKRLFALASRPERDMD